MAYVCSCPTIISIHTTISMLKLVDMGSEQDRGWIIKTERDYANLRGGSRSFYESRATHPIHGETIPARSIDETTAYQETLARIGRVESQMDPAMSMMKMVEIVEVEADTATRAETAVEASDTTPDMEMDTTTASLQPLISALSSAMPDDMSGDTYPVAPPIVPLSPPAPGDNEHENEQVQVSDPLAAEFGYNTRPLNLTRRVESRLANHRQTPRRRPAGNIILK